MYTLKSYSHVQKLQLATMPVSFFLHSFAASGMDYFYLFCYTLLALSMCLLNSEAFDFLGLFSFIFSGFSWRPSAHHHVSISISCLLPRFLSPPIPINLPNCRKHVNSLLINVRLYLSCQRNCLLNL